MLFLMLFGAMPALATVDLLTPIDGASTRETTLPFEYYASVPGLTGCTLTIGTNNFVSVDPQNNSINTITVQAIAPGIYNWSLACMGDVTETSTVRTISIDTTAPTLAMVTPSEGLRTSTLSIDVIPYDDITEFLSCETRWNTTLLDSFQIQRNTHYVKEYSATPGNNTLSVTCADLAGNTVTQARRVVYVPAFGLRLSLDKAEYALGESPRLTIDTLPGAALSVDVCPDHAGFVQCTTALIDTYSFPQTINLPITNKTGPYIIDGIATFLGHTKANQTRYTVKNTMSVQLSTDDDPRINKTVRVTASVNGGIPPYYFTWTLHNGTVLSGIGYVDIAIKSAGTFIQRVTAMDAANNTQQANISLVVDPLLSVSIQVLDNSTRQPIPGAEVDLKSDTGERESATTSDNGMTYFSVPSGDYALLASKTGYQYVAEEISINTSSTSFSILLGKTAQYDPQVRIIEPAAGATDVTVVRFTATHTKPLTCALQVSGDGAWFATNGSISVTDSAVKEFPLTLPAGPYNARVECSDAMGARGESATVQFTIDAIPIETTLSISSEEESYLQDSVSRLDALLAGIDSYSGTEKEAMIIIGYDRQLRNVKRAVLQAIRDMSDLQYRNDLDAVGTQVERERIMSTVRPLLASTPVSVRVIDSKTFVRYPKEDAIPLIAEQIAGLDGITSDVDRVARLLLPDQQKFTLSTKAMHVQYTYPDDTEKVMTLVQRSMTYAKNLSPEYGVIEIIPKEIAENAKDLTLLTEARIIKQDPVLHFGQQATAAYLIPKKVDFTRIETIQTVLTKPYSEPTNIISGYAIWTGQGLDELPVSLLILIAVIILAYLIYYFDIIKHVRFFIFKEGKQRPVHYVRVMINDAKDQLAGNNYEKAEMLYKEIRMMYDQLPEFAKNDMYEDVADLLRTMDAYYFNMVMMELDGHLKAGEFEAAIGSYEKLTRVYVRLDQDKQQELVNVVSGMARRMGAVAS